MILKTLSLGADNTGWLNESIPSTIIPPTSLKTKVHLQTND